MTMHLRDMAPAQQAGILCNDEKFRLFIGTLCLSRAETFCPEATAEYVRHHCGITSRRDLNTDHAARAKFNALRTEFDAWRGAIAKPR
ncbi:hypothetical protein [Yoonia sp. 208BN28-4]|uniref:hypothetical protein n=1 Tax=Yoonia sp. 208BN28-4 TaxID=3126505 RepID=UPI0030964EFF